MSDGDDRDGNDRYRNGGGRSRNGNDRAGARSRTARWGLAGCTVAVAALLAGLPWVARGRLPDRLATHWSGGAAPDGSMPLWEASLLPAGLWLLVALALSVRRRRSWPAARPWRAIALAPAAAVLVGAQACVVRANLDRTDWHEARDPALGVVLPLALAAVAGVVAWRLTIRTTSTTPPAPTPALDLPAGERLVWFSRAANPWLQLVAALTGLIAVGALVTLVAGLADPAVLVPLCAVCAAVSLAGALSSSVQAKVSEAGLEVSFGPLGWPARRWSPTAIESARAEPRQPSQVGGWGYRLSGLGTTVMLRAGDCLVVRPRGRRTDFAVSVDDAERGAALLNALRRRA
ncbi:DUF1648 domain-containing protein [Streptomyces barringtoniae]|uniref:DUF1648 domain-containing protein n=1 Tax=Streptomyces barringtoniae TaxID=2892029 RepID=UPI001E493033|nr:DUF1648 domain-containing protein [Streptomyces barringtoniae]MCC5477109.1 DUF1648 domain-containing protein [Streptomyces barringtoniae]